MAPPQVRTPSAGSRVQVVLIPGFAGFDALGQLEYYGGITPLFREWKKSGGQERADVVLHYFDNFPTASVVTRSRRLRDYLTKRIARGEFLPGDSVALVGHSTGGLDIRRLLWDLARASKRTYAVDGTKGSAYTVSAREVLRLIERVVFLSVPQRGTNIANWIRDYEFGSNLVIADLRASVEASQLPLLDTVENRITQWITDKTKLDIAYALQDALTEAEPGNGGNPVRTALAQEAGSELQLWLRHMATDFSVINDLAVEDAPTADRSGERSPAHFTARQRDREIADWKEHGIKTRSYATVGPCPFGFTGPAPVPCWNLLHTAAYVAWAMGGHTNGTDATYRFFYRACAGGPFTCGEEGVIRPTPLNGSPRRQIAPWENDGIVNTASMLWPNGNDTVLVEADHEDIVGHFKRVRTAFKDTGRKYERYDLLKSESGFREAEFRRVWHGVFDFCSGAN